MGLGRGILRRSKLLVQLTDLTCHRIRIALIQISIDPAQTGIIPALFLLRTVFLIVYECALLSLVGLFLQLTIQIVELVATLLLDVSLFLQLDEFLIGILNRLFFLRLLLLSLVALLFHGFRAYSLPGEGNAYTSLTLRVFVIYDECRLRTRLPDDCLCDYRWNNGRNVAIIQHHGHGIDQLGLIDHILDTALLQAVGLADLCDHIESRESVDGHDLAQFHRHTVRTHIDAHHILLLLLFQPAGLRVVVQ